MLITDTIADMLTRIRNALTAKHATVSIPCSTVKLEIARILREEGYIKGYEIVENGVEKNIVIDLRIYARKDNLPRVLNGMGIAIISTSRGIVTDRECRKLGIGGEVLAYVW